jgi:hypothetical protein
MLNIESTHCVESLNDTKQNSLIDVHDNVHLFSKCDSKGKKRKNGQKPLTLFLVISFKGKYHSKADIIQRHQKIHSKFIIE